MEHALLPVADRRRQIGFVFAFGGVERGQRLGLRLETCEPAQPLGEKRLVRRHAVNWIGANIDHSGQSLRRQQAEQVVVRRSRHVGQASQRLRRR